MIDLLRGISILLVALYHGDDFFTIQASALAPLFQPKMADLPFQSGYYGVTIFFVISGFLITRISLEGYGALRAIRLGNFYLSRFGRIVPCFGLALFVLLCLHFGHVRDFVCDTQKTSLSDLITYTLTFRYNLLFCKNAGVCFRGTFFGRSPLRKCSTFFSSNLSASPKPARAACLLPISVHCRSNRKTHRRNQF
jgi:peptidoglycan/LPS O-acetylase OafA/YrhL